MLKKALYILTAIVMFACGTSSINLFEKNRRPEVQKELVPYFDKLDSIYRANNIKIDYRNISSIQTMDSLPRMPYMKGQTYEGLYNRITKKVYINTSQMDAFWAGKYHDKVLIILAHEIGHSQGKGHSTDYCSVMYPSSAYSLYLLRSTPVVKIVTDIYLINYPLLEE